MDKDANEDLHRWVASLTGEEAREVLFYAVCRWPESSARLRDAVLAWRVARGDVEPSRYVAGATE